MALTLAVGQAGDDWLAATRGELGAQAGVLDRLAPVLPAGYDELNYPPTAALDLPRIVALADGGGDITTTVMRFAEAGPDEWRFRVYRNGASIPLADLLPLLDHLGMRAQDERAFAFHLDHDTHVHLHDVGVKVPAGVDLADEGLATELCRAFEGAFRGTIETDGFNRLVLGAGLTARQVEVVRAYARYVRQIGFPFSQQYIESTVVRHATITKVIVELFEHRFDPDLERPADGDAALRERLAQLLDAVPSLDDDRTLRALLMLVDATLRTNVYREGAHAAVPAR